MHRPYVAFDQGPLGTGTDFREPRQLITAGQPDDLPAAFAALEAARAAGLWVAGYASYELGYALQPRLAPRLPPGRTVPLLQFGVFDRPQPATALPEGEAALSAPEPVWSPGRYAEAFQAVHDYIAAGDIYQANLTFPLRARFTGTVEAVYARLRARQPVPHGALVRLGEVAILSRSPELFFAVDAAGGLTTRPMKGTAPRGANPAEDAALRTGLLASEKNRAENLMIVDLLRNDMSRVSVPGSVQVPELFAIESYRTLHQMVSRVTARLEPGVTIGDLFAALFPCG